MRATPIDDPSPVWDTIRNYLSDDYSGPPEEGLFWGVFDGEAMAGAFLIRPWNIHCYEVHGGVHKKYWGKGVEVCSTLGNALFDLRPCNKLVCPVPEYNRLMCKCLERCGMKLEGRVTQAWCKWMRFWDVFMYGIKKQERGPLWQS